MNRNCYLLALVASAFAAAPVSAQTGNIYAGVSVGNSTVETGVDNLTGSAALDEDDTGFKLFIGHRYSANVAVEAHYADLGEASLTGNSGDTFDIDGDSFVFTANNVSLKSEGTSLGVSGVLSLPLTENLAPYARIGVQYWDIDATISSGAGSATLTDDGTDLFWGLGVSLALTEQVTLRGEFERYQFDDDDVDFTSLGVAYQF